MKTLRALLGLGILLLIVTGVLWALGSVSDSLAIHLIKKTGMVLGVLFIGSGSLGLLMINFARKKDVSSSQQGPQF